MFGGNHSHIIQFKTVNVCSKSMSTSECVTCLECMRMFRLTKLVSKSRSRHNPTCLPYQLRPVFYSLTKNGDDNTYIDKDMTNTQKRRSGLSPQLVRVLLRVCQQDCLATQETTPSDHRTCPPVLNLKHPRLQRARIRHEVDGFHGNQVVSGRRGNIALHT